MTATVPASKSGSANVFVLFAFAGTVAVDSNPAVDSLAADLLLAISGLLCIRLLCRALSSSSENEALNDRVLLPRKGVD
jgi:hypothetical protein